MDRRVVVTGLGVVSSLGISINEFWNNIINGKSGISKITKLDISEFTSQIGAEIKNFNPEEYINAKEVKRLALFTQYAIFAANKALADSGLEINEKNTEKAGVLI